jgi:broad specificity phosphatase PhoE
MARLILVRHARTAETGIKLSGRIKGIPLSPAGRKEAAALAEALSAVQIAGIASSPMQRCLETAEAVRSMRGPSVKSRPDIVVDERLTEVEYGDWSGKELRKLMKDPLWSTVQRQPSAMLFPNGESLRAASARAVEAIREIDARFSDDETWLCASHGDIIKAIVADALGTPLDLFQRIAIDPASITVIRYSGERPTVVRVNLSAEGAATGLVEKAAKPSLLRRLRGDN